MKLRSWLLPVLLATLPIAAANAALVGPTESFTAQHSMSAPGFNDVSYLAADTRSRVNLLSDFSTSLPSMGEHGSMGEHDISVASADAQLCPSGNYCGGLLAAQFAAVGVRAQPKASGMTLLDLGLMLLFGVALVAYQLDRKQRLLRQTSLLPASLD